VAEPHATARPGLELSLEVYGTHGITICLAAFARLAFAEGDPDRTAMLAGAAKGLRRRAWPSFRREEAEVVTQVRGALGANRFDEAFAAGSRLNLREAVAAVRDQRGASTPAPEP
jgi:hypothetical protein